MIFSIAFSKLLILVAKDILIKFSIPNALPGTTATLHRSKRKLHRSISFFILLFGFLTLFLMCLFNLNDLNLFNSIGLSIGDKYNINCSNKIYNFCIFLSFSFFRSLILMSWVDRIELSFIGSVYEISKKEMNKKKEEYISIQENWKEVNWDLVQRMRFMNADAEIDPEDSYSRGERKFDGDNT